MKNRTLSRHEMMPGVRQLRAYNGEAFAAYLSGRDPATMNRSERRVLARLKRGVR